ncbi:MAG: hypothetical protein LBR34_07180 [Prevotella sp.]|jgi:hypothetical protein|nr:hypothetical protein [Prevotella sp.]
MTKRFQITLAFLLPCMAAYGQLSLGESYKRELMKTVAPENPMRLYQPKISESASSVTDNQILKAYESYKYKTSNKLMDMFKNEYKVSPNIAIYRGNTPLNKLSAGSTETVYMGGHFMQVSNAGRLVTPSGVSLTGGFKKGLSEKTKSILINVFGMEIEE